MPLFPLLLLAAILPHQELAHPSTSWVLPEAESAIVEEVPDSDPEPDLEFIEPLPEAQQEPEFSPTEEEVEWETEVIPEPMPETIESEPVLQETEAPAPPSNGIYLGTFESTAYAVGDQLTPGTVTANGTDVSGTIYSHEGYRLIAVDTSVIPLNSLLRVHIPGWEPFLARAADTGGAIIGHKIDLLMSSPQEALNYGRRYDLEIYLIH